ncbi:Ig-like domain-containing protein [Lactiplantibacillus fabifermentans]|uniref:Bacterial Ig domain-containing protein n=1 Tax=Lactiplantibacillus fabifermentans DSM 21115 TaxID=1413187 RepID=A0A0R2NRH7_9LACO|nr:Ig-like domain-containing protein [Lactiplantibacillus fabifermentans]KRO27996.1 hypothetical protein DY78_GL002732 [Lactiplantibacillus fabifermentans DSM 21115]
MKNWRRRLVVSLIILLGLVSWDTVSAQAAASGTTGSASYTNTSGTRLIGFTGYTLSNYIQFSAVSANNVENNRVTKYTTEIYATVDSSYKVLNTSNFTFSKAYLDVFDPNGKSLLTGTPTYATVSGSKVTFPTTKQTLKVDLSKLGTKALQLPIYVGVSFTPTVTNTDGSAMWFAYGFGKFSGDATVQNALADVTQVNASDQQLTGTAEPNSTVSVTLTVDGADQTFTAVTGADGKYTIALGKPLTQLGNPSNVTVTESNDMGDTKSATASVNQSYPVLSATNSTLTLTPDDLTDLTNASDATVIAWIVKQAGIVAKDSTTNAIDSDATFNSTTSGLADKLAALADGASLSVPIGATSNGTAAPTPLTITITKDNGTLKFTSVSDTLDYGSLQVPSKTTLFAPASAVAVTIADTRAAGSPWTVTATASVLTANDGSQKQLNGQLMYVDSTGAAQSLTSAVPVASGTRSKGVNSVNVTNDWATQSNTAAKTGIYLQAQPNIYTGANGTTYKGTVDWSLEDTPQQ